MDFSALEDPYTDYRSTDTETKQAANLTTMMSCQVGNKHPDHLCYVCCKINHSTSCPKCHHKICANCMIPCNQCGNVYCYFCLNRVYPLKGSTTYICPDCSVT